MSDAKKEVSTLDKNYFEQIRKNVSDFMANNGKKYDKKDTLVLDIAPQDHEGANPYFPLSTIQTLDINPSSGATYIADICKNNEDTIPSEKFDIVVCTEVLEHTLQPFNAADEISRILKPDGIVIVSAPFNFRIHGPLPDCWRFTEFGLRSLFSKYEILTLDPLNDTDRFLAPIHYTMTARKKKND